MLTTKQLIEELQISRSTLHSLVKKGLPHIKVGKNNRFELDEVINWLKNNKENKES